MRVLVVEHEASAGPGLVGEGIAARGWSTDVVGPGHTVVPAQAYGYDGVVVLGGTPGPEDDGEAPWLPSVRALVRDCLDRQVPLLGICLGAQLLAVVAGGRVVAAAAGPEIGLVELDWTDAAAGDPLLDGLPAAAPAVAWHHLEVADLPPGATSLAATPRCGTQAFRVGPVAWGLQFHLEATAPTALAWAREDDLAGLGLDVDAVVQPVVAAQARMTTLWREVTERWLAVVATRTGGRTVGGPG